MHMISSNALRCHTLVLTVAGWGLTTACGAPPKPPETVQFNRDVLPILSENCLACHGFDQASRAADLRLDIRAGATADRDGLSAVRPGRPDQSELWRRITSTDAAEVMPPPDTDKRLTAEQQDTLRRWIEQGAVYEQHWAFAPLVKPEVPAGDAHPHPIDAFVAHRLRAHSLELMPQAAWETLLRRVTLDLTGLPPTPHEMQAFEADLVRPQADPEACYERVVDRLLASKHFGEHLAVAWLDAARYADTNGYFGDKPRQMWLWRDWVINAFNANLPYDQFTIEQLAGDLLSEPTVQQRVATGFNRNHMANNETGIIAEEFRVEYVVDRVHTTMTTWLGLTAGCAQCHDHKFDPISQAEFYQLFAFFDNIPETGLITADNPPPLLEVPSAEQAVQRGTLAAEAGAAREAFAPIRERLIADITTATFTPPENAVVAERAVGQLLFEGFEDCVAAEATVPGTALKFKPGILGQGAQFDATQHIEVPLTTFQADAAWTIGLWCKPERSLSCPLSLIEPAGDRRGLEVLLTKRGVQVHLIHQWGVDSIEVTTVDPLPSGTWHHLAVTYDGSRSAAGLRVFIDGRSAEVECTRDTLSGSLVNDQPLRIGRRDSGLGFYGMLDEVRILQQSADARTVGDWYWIERCRGVLSKPSDQRSAADIDALIEFYLTDTGQAWFSSASAEPEDIAAAAAASQRLQAATRAEQQLSETIPTVLVMQEMAEPRPTYVLAGGQYDKPTIAVQPGVPQAIAPWLDAFPPNRLGFARWLVCEENGLTPRVAVNRLWAHCFGAGLVRTMDDFGTQGARPTHPELLDWLAATFRENGWNVKDLLRLIVTSQTYRQQSQFGTGHAQAIDPENLLLGRGPSGRLSAEMLRDQALGVSGLLVPTVGGPSVKPYQPAGLWEEVSYDGEDSYQPDTGEGLWRRSLYTYIKRQSPPPGLLVFDGPTREKCTILRGRTNTPLQALVLLNDQTFVEAARVLAAKTLQTSDRTDARLDALWKAVLGRRPQDAERNLLRSLLERQQERFSSDPSAARQLLAVGASDHGRHLDPVTLAAWTVVAHTVLNLDEAITKR